MPCQQPACRRLTLHFWRWKVQRPTCTWAGRRSSRRSEQVRGARCSTSCGSTPSAGSAVTKRFRQKLAPVPLGLNTPLWDGRRGASTSSSTSCRPNPPNLERGHLTSCMSRAAGPRPALCGRSASPSASRDGGIGVVGKAHHCMVDGIAAVELAALLLDPTPEPPAAEPRRMASRHPHLASPSRLARAVGDQLRADSLHLARAPARLMLLLRARLLDLRRRRPACPAGAGKLAAAGQPGQPPERAHLERRHLALVRRSLGELKQIKDSFGVTVNDVILASAASGSAPLFEQRGGVPRRSSRRWCR